MNKFHEPTHHSEPPHFAIYLYRPDGHYSDNDVICFIQARDISQARERLVVLWIEVPDIFPPGLPTFALVPLPF